MEKWRKVRLGLMKHYFLSIAPIMPDSTITVVKKQAPTPRKSAPPSRPKPHQIEKTNEPNVSIVVSEVSKIAGPVPYRIITIECHGQRLIEEKQRED